MNLRNYPMDTQRCTMKIGMFFHSDDDVLLKWAEERETFYFESLVVHNNVRLPQFEIQNTSAEKVTQEWKTGNFTYLLATFEFQRNVHFYVLTSYIPSSLVVVVSWVSFWLDVKAAPARVALGITSLLTLATQMVQSHLSLPPVSYVKALDVWMFFCLFMVFSSLIEYACSYTLAAISSNQKPLQSSFDRMGFQLRRNLIFGASNIEVKDITEGPTGQEVEHKARSSATHPRENIVPSLHPRYISTTIIDYISRILFPFSFVVFIIAYWSIYASDH
ncbi:glycine receptor subunit alphaZ1-like [Tachypleus tridentatus]|uniref:glycine receptor subunit alphaZ1-like n=1 Tax=Tachypleus tridentatus TaxID=6853 RepID=UPI003FD056AA